MEVLSRIYLLCSVFAVAFLLQSGAAQKSIYIVYMGAGSADGSLKDDHSQLMSSVQKWRKNAIVYSYNHGISGFAARLSEEEAQSIAKKPGVVSVFLDPVYRLHTTRSWDFLKYGTDVEIDFELSFDSTSTFKGSDTIVGILDTGIWPESESFSDKYMGPIPPRWKGTCVEKYDFNSSNCNRKIIGARNYNAPFDVGDELYNTPRDQDGHGTHVASTIAGTFVPGASYYGLAMGNAGGGSPGSRIAVYRVCSENGCHGSSILAAFSDAIADGVDIISVSLGSSDFKLEFKEDSIAIGAFHAVENGITVVCSAGNDGPAEETVTNSAPWILTVAATTIDRKFESNVVFGGNKVIKGEGINFANIGNSPVHPLIYAESAKLYDGYEYDARNCNPGSMDQEMIEGTIVVCVNDDDSYSDYEKMDEVQELGGIGLVLVDDGLKGVASNYEEFPMTVIGSKDASEILSYINSTRNPVATIVPTVVVPQYKPAPTMTYFSSRGPSAVSDNILKPDIAAPGTDIVAAWKANDTEVTLVGTESPPFNVISGTSMACPHVSAVAALVKSRYPLWSPSAIKSAVMTTASQMNNMNAPITTEIGAIATAYDYGAGEINASRPLQPGLIYETTTIDYLNFLCFHGYDTSTIKVISKDVPDHFTCPEDSTKDLISDINYPSIVVTNLIGKHSRTINRTLTNVAGDGITTYSLSIEAPNGMDIAVSPTSLEFTKNGQRLTYQVVFIPTISSLKDDMFGSIMWTNTKYKVRTPFVVSRR